MNQIQKQAIDILSNAVENISDVKVKTDIQSLGELSDAFLKSTNKTELKRLTTEFKRQHEELHKFLADNPGLVNAEVERALLSAALGGEYVDEEVKISASGKRTYKRTKKRVAPNASAALSYLQNKDKENWSPNPRADPELEDTSEIEEDIYGSDS